MEAKAWVMFRVLLNRYHPTNAPALLKFLPGEEVRAIQDLEIKSDDVDAALVSPKTTLSCIHYSWLLPLIQALPTALQNPLVNSLSEAQAQQLRALVDKTSSADTPIAPTALPVQTFLIEKLYRNAVPATLLPLPYLPQSTFTALAHLEKAQIVELIDFLGIHDVAESMRYIIDKNSLKKIFDCLSDRKKQFLKRCLQQQEKMTATRLDLTTWDGNCDKLDTLVHRRGLLRLGKALCGQHSDLMWYITHTLDSGRGQILLKHFSPTPIAGITSVLAEQVINVMKFIEPKNAP
jgi:hypothetical protein